MDKYGEKPHDRFTNAGRANIWKRLGLICLVIAMFFLLPKSPSYYEEALPRTDTSLSLPNQNIDSVEAAWYEPPEEEDLVIELVTFDIRNVPGVSWRRASAKARLSASALAEDIDSARIEEALRRFSESLAEKRGLEELMVYLWDEWPSGRQFHFARGQYDRESDRRGWTGGHWTFDWNRWIVAELDSAKAVRIAEGKAERAREEEFEARAAAVGMRPEEYRQFMESGLTREEWRWITPKDRQIFFKSFWGILARGRMAVGGEALPMPVLDSIYDGHLTEAEVIFRDLVTGNSCGSKLMLERNEVTKGKWLIGYFQECDEMCTRSTYVHVALSMIHIELRNMAISLAFDGGDHHVIKKLQAAASEMEVELPSLIAELEAKYRQYGTETVPYAADCR